MNSDLVQATLQAIAPALDPAQAKAIRAEAGGAADVGTALMLHPKVRTSTRLVRAALAIMAPTLGRRNAQDAVDELDRRLYRNASGNAEVIPIVWSAHERPGGMVSVDTTRRVEVDGSQFEVRIVPFYCGLGIDVSYVRKERKDVGWVSNGVWHSILIRGKAGADGVELWYAFPLGLCPPTELEMFNEVAAQMKEPTIPVVPNGLRRLDSRRFEWTPSAQDWRPANERSSAITLGFYNGKRVVLPKNTPTLPPYRLADDNSVAVFHPGVFEYVEYLNHIVVRWLGKPGKVPLVEERAPTLDERVGIDPFAVLGKTPLSLDPDRLASTQERLIETIGSPNNPAVRYARGLGLVRDGDSLDVVRAQTVPLIRRAATMAAEVLEAVWRDLSAKVDVLRTTVELDRVLRGKDLATVRNRRGGTDALAEEIGKTLGSWDWRSPMHLRIRAHLLDEITKLAPVPPDAG